ncbi:MAG: hypothetical protein WCG84_01230 [Candidatus Moraniibacteriota bacterium]
MDKETKKFFENIIKTQSESFEVALNTKTTVIEASIQAQGEHFEAAMNTQLTEVVELIRDVVVSVDTRFGRLEEETQEIKEAVLRIEHTLQDKQEAQGDLIQDTRQRVDRIEDHLHLPHSLSATTT